MYKFDNFGQLVDAQAEPTIQQGLIGTGFSIYDRPADIVTVPTYSGVSLLSFIVLSGAVVIHLLITMYLLRIIIQLEKIIVTLAWIGVVPKAKKKERINTIVDRANATDKKFGKKNNV